MSYQGRKENNRNAKKLIYSNITGVVKRYIESGGYGFITEDGTNRDVFFHISAFSYLPSDDPIRVGDEVIYDLYLSPKGYRAESVQILNQDGSDSDDSYNDNLYRRKNSGTGWSRQRESNDVGEENQTGRRSRWPDARGGNYRAESVERGYGREDESDDESDGVSWRVPSRDRIPRSHNRAANGSTSRTRSTSRGWRQGWQEEQPGVKEGKQDSGFFCQYCQCFHFSSKRCIYQDGSWRDNVTRNVKGSNESSRGSQVPTNSTKTSEARKGASPTRFPRYEPTYSESAFSYQGTQRGKAETKSNTQSASTARTSSFFDHFTTPNDTWKGGDIKKNHIGNRDSFRRASASSQKSSTGTQYTTNNDAENDISKNPSKTESSYRSGIPSAGNGKETRNTTDTTADKSDTKQNPQPGRRSTVYSYSYADGSNRYTRVPVINNNRSRESSSSAASQQIPASNSESVPTGGRARASVDSKTPTEDRGAKDEVKSTHKGHATNQLPDSQSKGTGGPTASKENPTTEGPKAKTSTSLSSMSREAGNMLFRSARDHRSNTIKYFKLKGALQCYTSAYYLSRKDEDMVSAAKNTATTYWRLAELMRETGGASDEKAIHDYFKDALQYFSKAYPKRNCRGQAWAKHLEKAMQDCLDDIRTWIAPKDEDDRIEAMDEYLGYLPACGAKVNGYLYIAKIYLKRGKEALKFDEYENCQGYLKECRVPLGEAEKMCTNVDPSIQLCVDALKRSVEYHEGLVKRYIARVKDMEARQQRERAEESAKQIAMDQMKTDIKALDLFAKLPVEDFVKQVYRVWPPKVSNGPNPPSSSSSSSSSAASKKKLLIRAISHYHPDKVDKNVHGIKLHLLSCEITKCLNMRLASTK